jgi:fibronectin-binding autotransporter adhesin
MKPRIRTCLLGASSLLAAPLLHATPFTWTSTAAGTYDWTIGANWSGSAQYVSDAANELIFFSDSTTNFADPIGGARNINTNVPATLAMNTLTLNGKGNTSGASPVTVNIASSASTWTIGDGTTSVVNLNANQGASTAAGFNYNVAANLTLNQAAALFTGNGTGGVHTGATDTGFVFSGSIGQSASGYGITKSGSSRLTLSSANLTFTGPLTVNGGSLFLTGNSNLPSGSMTVNTGAILRIGNNTATQIGASGNYSGNISTGTGGTLQLWSSSAQEYSGVISGSGGIQKAYVGQLTLSGANTYTGKTQFLPQSNATGFTVKVSSFNSVVGGTASSSLGAPATVANGTIDLGNGSAQASANLTYEANAGGGATGETTDRVINLQFNATSDRTITANNASGVLRFTSAFTSNGGGQNGKLILAGTGAGQVDQGLPQLGALGLDKQGPGTWTLGGSGNFTGPTLITAGTLSLSSATVLQNSPLNTASVAGGPSAGLKIATTTLSLGGLTGSSALDGRFTTALGGPSNLTTKGGYDGLTTLTLTNAANTTSTYSGNIVEGATGMALTKTGAGTQFLNGTNSHTGLTTVNGGTLGSGTGFSGAVTASNGGILSPGASAGAFGTLTISSASASALTLNGGYLQLDLSTATSDLIAVTGNTVLGGTNIVLPNTTTGVAAGTYDLVTYAATTGSGSVVFANGSTTLGNATLAVNAGNIRMTVGAGGLNNCVWVGTTATWDSGTNWNRNGTPASSFVDGDFVTIDDTGSNTATITSAGTVSPASLTVNNSSKAFTISATIGGTGTPLVKLGTNTLTLSGTNAYDGGTVINAGILSIATNANLGAAGGGITLNGGQLSASANISASRIVTVNGVGSSMRVPKNNNITTTGKLTGSGTLTTVDNGGAGNLSTYNFNSTSNDFTGRLIGTGTIINVNSLGDSTNSIALNAGTFNYGTGATGATSLPNRVIELSGTTGGATINNNNTTAANDLSIGGGLLVTGAGNKTLTLGGANFGANTIAGNLSDGSGSVISLTVNGANWIVPGDHSHTGQTTVSGSTGATLTLSGNNSAMTGGVVLSTATGTSASSPRLNINSATALGTGILNFGGGAATDVVRLDNTSAGTVTVSTANAFTLNRNFTFVGTQSLNLGAGTTTIGPVSLVGSRTISVTNNTLTLGGPIAEAAANLGITKAGAGTLVLSGSGSTYTGATTASAGTLVGIGANAFGSTSGISIAAAGTLSLRGNSNTSFVKTSDSSLYTVNNSASAATINVDRVSGTGAAIMSVGNLTTSSTAATWSLNFTGASGAGLNAGALSTPVSTVAAVHTINNNIAGGGAVTLASVFNQATTIASPDLVFGGSGNTTVTGAITQTLANMDLIKNDAGTLTLGGSNTYTGATTVNAGTLIVTGATQATSTFTFGGGILGFDVASSVTAASATVNFTGQQVLVTGTPTLASYTLLTASSITGTPTLASPVPGYTLVTDGTTLKLNSTGAPVGYAAWQAANSTAGTRGQDHDNDGVDNGTEHFLGGTANTTGFTALPTVANTLGTLSVTWTKAASYTGVYATDFVVETSATLAGPWAAETLGVNVTITGNNVKYTFPGGPAYSGKNFARLKVTGP